MGLRASVVALGLLLSACRRGPAADAAVAPPRGSTDAGPSGAPPSTPRDGQSVHFSRLKPFLPHGVLDYRGGELHASTSQFGGVAVSEIERAYQGPVRRAKVRILDTNLNQQAGAALTARGEGIAGARPLAMAGAVGYATYDADRRHAQASVVVADRFVVAVTVESADGDGDAEAFARALDLAGIGGLAGRSIP